MDFSNVLLTVDYDRTLTAPDSSIPERNLEAIRYFMENGGAFTINTGRSLAMAQPFLDKVPMNAPVILYNGAAAYDLEKKELLFYHKIDLDPWQTIAKCHELFPELMVEFQGMDAHYRFWENPMWDAFYDHNQVVHRAAYPGDDIGPFLKFSIFGPLKGITVGDLFQATEEELQRMEAVCQALTENFGHKCQVFKAAPRILDVQTHGISKGLAARELQEKLGRKILVCAGDAHNDLPMLQDADYAYVPADAALADQFENVCKCADGAVADVIYKKIPEILQKTS